MDTNEDRLSRDEAQLISPELLVIILMNLLHLAIWMACQTKCYNHIPLINPWYREEETQNTDSHNIIKLLI